MALKARAYINLLSDKEAGRQINTKDIMKHRNDVLKLAATMTGTEQIAVEQEIVGTINEFSERLLGTLPNQSLQDALRSSETVLRLYLESLPTFYTVR